MYYIIDQIQTISIEMPDKAGDLDQVDELNAEQTLATCEGILSLKVSETLLPLSKTVASDEGLRQDSDTDLHVTLIQFRKLKYRQQREIKTGSSHFNLPPVSVVSKHL